MKDVVIYLPLVIWLVGGILYPVLDERFARARELARIMFAMGLLAWLLGGMKV